ncbi:MAG: CotH kinase family protein, partial [Myxococcota bacterium]
PDEPLATGWRLDRSGGALTVLDDAGEVLDEAQWGQVAADVSLARFPDTTGATAPTAWPTPGAPNGDGPSPTLDPADATVFLPFVMHRIDFGFRGDARVNIDRPTRPEVRVTMTVDGVTIPDVGLSLKGSASYDTMDRKPAFNVDVNAFDPEAAYRGLDGFKLHNGNVLDPTRDRDYLTYQLAREVGLFAPRIGWAEVWCDDDYYGLYIVVEDHDDEMIEYYFPGQQDLGVVLEPNEDSGGQFLFADFGTGKLDRSDYEEGPVPPDPNVILALRRSDAVVSEPPTDENLAAFFDDVDEQKFLSYLAWETVVAHTDGYKAVNNWRLYVDGTTRVIELVPSGAEWTWDFDADLWSSAGNAAQWCFANDGCARAYAERVVEVADTADALGLYDQFLALQEWLDPYIRTDPRYPHTEDVGSARTSTASHLVGNPEAARSQVFQQFPDLE